MSTYPLEVSKTPMRDEQVQELPSAQGLLAANKNISFLHRLNRDPQYTFFKSQPGGKTKGHLTGWQASLADREVEKVSNTPSKAYTRQPTVNCAHGASTQQRKHLQEEGLEQHLEHPGVAFAGIC